jgi:hypothetical protein
MFVPFWLIFLATGLVMAVFAVVWGIRTSQFDNQDRARFIPLFGLNENELSKEAPRHRADYVAVMVLVGVGMSAMGAGLFLALRHM